MLAPVLALLLAAPAPAAPATAPAPAAPARCGLPSLAARPWRPGERLLMDLALLTAVKVGEVTFSVERPSSGGAVVPLVARARNTARFGPLQRLIAVGLSWVDAATLRPEHYREESDEDGRRRSTDVRLRPPAAQVTLESADGSQRGRQAYDRQGEVLDPVSAMYLLRAARLTPGASICFDLVANGKYWRFEGKLAPGTETFEVPAGRFEAIRIEGTARRADGAGKSRGLWLWLSADARRLPLAAVSEVDLGMVSAKLVEVSGADR
jgi:hypothetical protein